MHGAVAAAAAASGRLGIWKMVLKEGPVLLLPPEGLCFFYGSGEYYQFQVGSVVKAVCAFQRMSPFIKDNTRRGTPVVSVFVPARMTFICTRVCNRSDILESDNESGSIIFTP